MLVTDNDRISFEKEAVLIGKMYNFNDKGYISFGNLDVHFCDTTMVIANREETIMVVIQENATINDDYVLFERQEHTYSLRKNAKPSKRNVLVPVCKIGNGEGIDLRKCLSISTMTLRVHKDYKGMIEKLPIKRGYITDDEWCEAVEHPTLGQKQHSLLRMILHRGKE